MTISGINNVIYLKDFHLNESSSKKSDRKKVDEEDKKGLSAEANQVREVEKENLSAALFTVTDPERAREVLQQVKDHLENRPREALLAHSGKVINPDQL